MSTDKTLADVQPGGRVRLATLPRGCDACHRTGIRQNDEGRNVFCPECDLGMAYAGNPPQPSPGGQGALVTDAMVEAAHAAYWAHPDDSGEDRPCMRAALEAALAARQPVGLTELGWVLKRATPEQVLQYLEDDPNMRACLSIHLSVEDEPVDDDDAANEAFAEFADDYLTDGKGYAPASTYAACGNAFKAAWPDRDAATAAARAELKRLHGDDRTVGERRAEALNREATRDDDEGDTAPPAQAVEMSPEFTDTARAAIAWVLWHHQGGSSPVGQPLRFALGMGQHDRMTDQQIAEAKRFAAWANATTEDFHQRAPAQAVDLEQFREAVVHWYADADNANTNPAWVREEASRLLAVIDNYAEVQS